MCYLPLWDEKQTHFLMQDVKYDKCVKWDLMSGSSMMSYEFPNKHPMKHETYTDKMRPKEATFRFLKETVDTAIQKMMTGDWTETNVKIYCSANGLNVLGIHKLVDSINTKLAL